MSPRSACAGGFFAACFSIIVTSSPALAGPEWVEVADAGSFFNNAQPTFGEGQLMSIAGRLEGGSLVGGSSDSFGEPDFGDVFLFSILVPTIFTMQVAQADFNAQLFLFNITQPGELFGLLANNDTANGNAPFMGNAATDNSGAQVLLPGQYAMAITGNGRVPVGVNGNIFFFASPTEVSGPDGPGGINPLNEWIGVGEVGSYTVVMTGTGFYALPTPGGIGLMIAAGVFGRRRRRCE